eukprot:SAG25_NODE_14178_length_258_cov_0.647799_1_plen_70_part_10
MKSTVFSYPELLTENPFGTSVEQQQVRLYELVLDWSAAHVGMVDSQKTGDRLLKLSHSLLTDSSFLSFSF